MQPAFTLIELMVVFAVMLMMSTLVAISLTGTLGEARLRSGGRMVIGKLNYARSFAVTNRQETSLLLDTQNQRLVVQRQDGGEWRDVASPAGHSRRLPDGITITDISVGGLTQSSEDESRLSFSTLGASTDAKITLANNKGKQLTITVDALTGRSEVSESTDEE